jgi:hypothetical protein
VDRRRGLRLEFREVEGSRAGNAAFATTISYNEFCNSPHTDNDTPGFVTFGRWFNTIDDKVRFSLCSSFSFGFKLDIR